MKIALAQINPTVGDLGGNAQTIIEQAGRAQQKGANLVVFPELCVTGYPPLDLLENPAFIRETRQVIEHIARKTPSSLGIILGAPVPNESKTGGDLFNAALLFEDGEQKAEVHKTLLPTYDVFDEHRYFEPAEKQQVVEWRGHKIGLHICEDMWNNDEQAAHRLYEKNPLRPLAEQGAEFFLNISASPFSAGKHAKRNRLIEEICADYHRPFAFANTVGANTEIIFDGDSRVHAGDGRMASCAASFAEELLMWDTEAGPTPCETPHEIIADVHDALVLGIRDYYRKTGIFAKVLVGLSGGIDSAVTAALAAEALGPEKVEGVTMPSRYSSSGSVTDSEKLAEHLGIGFQDISIKPAVEAFDDMLAAAFAGTEEGVAEENIQARARGVVLMALSNKFDHLVLATGNKSEMAIGYSTLYGDMNGGLAVLADVLKTRVYALARYINEQAGRPVIPQNTLDKPPSAELRPGQKDQDTLPPYETLDAILRRYIEEQQDQAVIVQETGLEEALVAGILRKVDRNEYKRRQAAPGLRVSGKAFGLGRRQPLVMQWERNPLAQREEVEV